MTDDQLQQLLNRSSAGGRHAALEEVVEWLRTKAAELFVGEHDVEAHLVRVLAGEVERRRAAAAKELADMPA